VPNSDWSSKRAGLTLYATLQQVRPSLQMIGSILNPLVMKFIAQEYYLFWVDDSRSLLSNTRFTYTHQIEQMTVHASLLPLAAFAGHYFQTR
jgi:hypothetical protein